MADLANQGEVNEWTRDQSSVDRGAACTDTSNQQGEWSEQKTRNRHPPETQKEWENLLSSEMLISLWIVTSIPRGTLHKMSKDLLSDGIKNPASSIRTVINASFCDIVVINLFQCILKTYWFIALVSKLVTLTGEICVMICN